MEWIGYKNVGLLSHVSSSFASMTMGIALLVLDEFMTEQTESSTGATSHQNNKKNDAICCCTVNATVDNRAKHRICKEGWHVAEE